MKDSVFALQIRFFPESFKKSRIGTVIMLSGALVLCAGCRSETHKSEQRTQAPVVGASGEATPRAPTADVPRARPIAAVSEEKSGEVEKEDDPKTEQQPGDLRMPPERYVYPRGRRIPVLEGMDKENLFRFVQVSEDSVRQVSRFYRKRFSLAPYQYGEGDRVQYLFSHGSGMDGVRVRVASLEAELDGIGAKPGDRTVVSLRVQPLPSRDSIPKTDPGTPDSVPKEAPSEPAPQNGAGSQEQDPPQ